MPVHLAVGARTFVGARVLALILCVSGPGRVEEAVPAPRTARELSTDLQKALAASDDASAVAALDGLVALGTPEAFDAILDRALAGARSVVEARAVASLAAKDDPKLVSRMIESLRKNPNPRTRILLLDVLGKKASKDSKGGVLDAIHKSMKDPSKPVALAALKWVRDLKRTESVESLIAELEAREKKGLDRVYFDVRRSLETITGFDLEAAVDWKNFWSAQKKGLSAPAKAKEKEGRTVAYKPPSFFSIAVDSDRVLFVIDISHSMTERDEPDEAAELAKKKAREAEIRKGATAVAKKVEKPKAPPRKGQLPLERERLWRVKAELARVLGSLQPHVRFGVIAFSHELKSLWDARQLKNATAENKAAALAWVKGLQADGATRTDKAMSEAFTTPEVDTIFLLTDGAPRDEKNVKLPVDPILAQVREANRFVRARIHTISFKQIKDREMVRLVRQLAAENDGEPPLLLP